MTLENRTDTSAGPAAGAARRTPGYAGTLAAACCAVLVAMVANALPASLNGLLQEDLHTQGSQLTWITASFMVTVVVFEFSFGVLGDLFGRKKLVAAGAVLVALGGVVFAVAPNVYVTWIGAGLSGLGAGAIFPASLAMVAAFTHTPAARAKSIAIWAGFLSAGAAISPLIGGIFAQYSSWRGSLWLLAGLSILSLVITLFFAAESRAAEGRKLDIPGQVTFAAGLTLVMYGAIQGPEDGWGKPYIVGAFVVGVVILAAFALIERRAASPILNLDLFKNRAFTVTSIVTVISMFTFLGADYATSMWLGPVQHQSAIRVGLLFLLLQGPAFILIPVISWLLARVSAKWLLTAGIAAMALGSLACTQLNVTDTALTPFVLPDALLGIGFALTMSSFTAVALNTVPLHLAGMASATTNMLRDLGFALGPVIVGAAALSHAGSGFMAALPKAGLPVSQLGPAMGIGKAAGPIAVNSLPPGTPGSAAHLLALQSLGSGFGVTFGVCAVAGLAAAALTVVGMLGVRSTTPTAESLTDPLHDDAGLAGAPAAP